MGVCEGGLQLGGWVSANVSIWVSVNVRLWVCVGGKVGECKLM